MSLARIIHECDLGGAKSLIPAAQVIVAGCAIARPWFKCRIGARTGPLRSRRRISGHGCARVRNGGCRFRTGGTMTSAGSCPERDRHRSPLVAEREPRRQVQDDAPHRDDDFGAELEQPFAQRVHLRAGEARG